MKKTICLNMIVKNESHVIERCLESVKKIIDYWVIVDTGSEDGTQEIIKQVLKDIPGELHERPWINFEYNRNEALSLALDKADYIFFIVADDRLIFGEDFALPELEAEGYWMVL
jgi:glycosyltransferase involved in cell wall biosynthesis